MDIERGEVIKINLNPTEGREQSGNARPCLVIRTSRQSIAIDGSFIKKSGKATYGIEYFYNGSAGRAEKG